MNNLLTRLGEGSRMVVLGDPSQSDLPPKKQNGLSHFLNAHATYNQPTGGLSVVQMCANDIQRHALIPMILDIYSTNDDELGVDIDDEFEIGILPRNN